MEDYGVGGTLVPFGDGTHVPDEDEGAVLSENLDNSETYMQNIIRNIFLTCDTENTDMVPVSKLVEFIRPFMLDHLSELVNLQKALDPDDIDVSVDSETFFTEMTIWASKIAELSLDTVLEEKFTESDFGQMETQINHHLLMNGGARKHVSKGYIGYQNIAVESGSYYFDANNQMDPIYLQEQIKELDYQNRKLSSELENVRLLLANSDEQIYNLQGEVAETSRKLILEQQMNDQLLKNNKFNEDMVETTASAQQEILKLEKLLVTSNKEASQKEIAIHILEKEKQHLEEKIDQLKQNENTTKASLMELQSELNYKDQVIISLEDGNTQLKSQLEEQQQVLTHFTDVNEQLKLEKSKLEKNFRLSLTRKSLSNYAKSPSHSYTDAVEHAGIPRHLSSLSSRRFSVESSHTNTPDSFKMSPTFNSPALLSMLKNPISPNLSLYKQKKLSVVDDNIFNLLMTEKTSTPNKKTLKVLCNNIQCSPQGEPQQHVLTSDTECAIQADIIDSNLNIINSNKSRDFSLFKDNGSPTGDLHNIQQNYLDTSSVLDIEPNKGLDSFNGSQFEASSEDEGFWKLQMVQHSPRESLESEMLQASDNETDGFIDHNHYKQVIKQLQRKICDYENHLQQLRDEVDYLKQQGVDKLNSKDDKSFEIDQLKNKIKNFQPSVEKCNMQQLDEINVYKTKLSELQTEHDKFRQHFESLVYHKFKESKHFPTLTDSFVELQKKLDQCLQKESELTKKNHTLVEENCNLKNEITSLTSVLCKINKEKPDILVNLKMKNGVEAESISDKLRRERLESWLGLEGPATYQHKTIGKYGNDSFKKFILGDNLAETLQGYKDKINSLTNEVNELNVCNGKIIQIITERDLQINTLKDMMNLQNTKMAALENDKSNAMDKLYETKTINNRYFEEIHTLKKKLSKLDKEATLFRNSNNSTKGQFKCLNGDFIKMKDSYDNILIKFKDLQKIKEELQLRNDELASNCNLLEAKITQLEENLKVFEKEKEDHISKESTWALKTKELNSKLFAAENEKIKLESALHCHRCNSQKNYSEEVALLTCKINELEELNTFLKLESEVCLSCNKTAENNILKDQTTSVDDNSKHPNLTNGCVCQNCKVLKHQLLQLQTNETELKNKIVSLEHEIRKRKNFERMLTRIDKLKQRIEELELRNDQFQSEIQENLKKYTQEKNIITNEKKLLEEKLRKHINNEQKLKDLETEVKTQVAEKESAIKKNTVLEGKILSLQKEKQRAKDIEDRALKTYKDLKKMQNEKIGLEQEELRDKEKLKELEQALLNSQLSLKRVNKEKNMAIKDKLTVEEQLNQAFKDLQKIESEKQLLLEKNHNLLQSESLVQQNKSNMEEQQKHLELVINKNSQLLQENQILASKKAELEKTIQFQQESKQILETKNLFLDKQLKDLQSNSSSMSLLQDLSNCTEELSEVQSELNKSKNKFEAFMENLDFLRRYLIDKRQKLTRSTITLISCWHSVLQYDLSNSPTTDDVAIGESLDIKTFKFNGILDDELKRFQYCVDRTTELLDLLINLNIVFETSSPPTLKLRSGKTLDNDTQLIEVKPNLQFEVNASSRLENNTIEDISNLPGYCDISFNGLLEEDLQRFDNIPIVCPTLTDDVLGSLDWLHNAESSKWSEDELDNKFSLLAAYFAVDVKSIQERFQQQHDYHSSLEIFTESIFMKVESHMQCMINCIKEKKVIEAINLYCLYMEFIHKLYVKTNLSAIQYGALNHEQSFLKCIALTMNYAANLSKKVDLMTQQYKSLSSSGSRRQNSVFFKVSDVDGIPRNFFTKKVDINDKHNMVVHKTSSVSIIPWLRTFSILFFVVIFILCCIIVEMHRNNAYPMLSYPWDWISWEEILSPFIKRSYPNGPPPT